MNTAVARRDDEGAADAEAVVRAFNTLGLDHQAQAERVRLLVAWAVEHGGGIKPAGALLRDEAAKAEATLASLALDAAAAPREVAEWRAHAALCLIAADTGVDEYGATPAPPPRRRGAAF